ncbi:MAG: calcium-binding protein, partial [Rhodospirillaceae bacterium]|nr:calcium-binding protein [Rhodospirillaceae bacterium]
GVPTGASLSAGSDNGDGSWTLTSAQLTGLSITPPSDDSADFALTVTATSTDGSDSSQSVGTVNVSVSGVADTASLTVADTSGNEDAAISLTISSALSDSSESLSVVISGVPTGATLSAGNDNGDGSWTLTTAQLTGLTITPPSNDSADFSLTVTSTSTDGSDTASTVDTIDVTVNAVADTPSLTVADTSGSEDTAISLTMSSALADSSESLSVVISGVPTGATLSAGNDNGDGSWTLTSAQLSGLTITPPSNDSADFALTVTATSTDGSDTASTVDTIDVTVNAVADAPTLSVADTSGSEDTAISLTLSSALSDSSESLSVVISGVPTGATLSAGNDNGDGSWTLTSAQLSGLTITPPSNDSADFALTVTATSTDGSDTAQSVGTVNVTVAGVADAPTLTANDVTGSEDASISLSLSAALVDSSETLGSITISSVPAGTQFSAGTNNGDGSWTFTSAQLSGLSLTPPPDRDTNFTLNVAVTSSETDGSDTATSNGSFTVTVNPVADTPDDITFSGDGVDENAANGTVVGTATGADPDTGESFTYSLTDDAGGRFAIDGSSGQITVADGSLLNFEEGMSHDITIRATDSTGRTYDETKAITVNDLNESTDTYHAEVMDNSPVGYWRMADTTGTTMSDEISGLDGTYVNHVSGIGDDTDPFANITSVTTDFEGVNDYASIADSDVFELTDGSIQIWFNSDSLGATQTIISRDAGGDNEGDIYIDLNTDGSLYMRLQGTDGGNLSTATGLVSANTWYQMTFTFGANGAELFLNGTSVASDAAVTGGLDGSSADWSVGAYNGGSDYFNGELAELAFFDTQLAEAAIDDMYAAGHTGTDLVTETSGNDTNTGTTGDDLIAGGAGNDHLTGNAGDDRLYGDDGDDYLAGGANADILSGGDGADELRGQSGIDTLSGGDGDDILWGGSQADILMGGSGSDTAVYSDSGAGVTINLTTGAASGDDADGDTLTSIENLTGSAYADTLTGNSDANIFTGNAGDDIFQGLGGADTMYGGDGSDTFTIGEGDGNDIIDGGAGNGWTDSLNLLNSDNSAVGSGWTVSLSSGNEVSDNGSTMTFSDDAAGTITLEDGTQIAFQNIETIEY